MTSSSPAPGSAGCVIAARLSESGRHRVLLLEAGPPDRNPWIHIPLGFAKTYVNPAVNWKFETAPQPQLANRRLYLPRGKTLGGSSSINGMVYMRGNHADYDEWRQRGCEGWDWDSVLPYFKKAENQTNGADEFHGVGGPLQCVRSAWTLRACRCGDGGVRAGRHSAQSRLQRRAAGRLRLLPDHHQQPAPLEHGEGVSASRTAARQSGGADRRACHARADREQPRGRRRVPHRVRAAAPPVHAARSSCRVAPTVRRSFCCCRALVRRSICRTWASAWSATCRQSAPTCTTISTPM